MDAEYWQGLHLGKGCHLALGVPAGTAVEYTSIDNGTSGYTGIDIRFQLSIHSSATDVCKQLSASAEVSYAGLLSERHVFLSKQLFYVCV